MKWQDYEVFIHKHFSQAFPDAKISHNVKIPGLISKKNRQIDILIEQSVAGFPIKIVADCKCFKKNIDVKTVESFISFLHDVKANKGVMITNVGYSEAAYNRAYFDTLDLDLKIIKFEDLEKHQGFIALPYAGPYFLLVSAPDGWIIDGKKDSNIA